MYVHVCAHTLDGVASRGQQRVSDPAELEWQVTGDCLSWVPRSELRSSAGAVYTVSHHLPSSLAILFSIFHWRKVNQLYEAMIYLYHLCFISNCRKV